MNDLLAERTALTRMIAALPASSVIDRASLTARLEEVEFRIREAEVSEGRVVGVQCASDGTGPCPEGAGQTVVIGPGEWYPPEWTPYTPPDSDPPAKARERRYHEALVVAINALRSIRPADRTPLIRAAIDAAERAVKELPI